MNKELDPVTIDRKFLNDLTKRLEGNSTIIQKVFVPGIVIFALLAFGGFSIIYSITVDMSKLAQSMDPNMGQNMSSMTKSISNLSKNITKITNGVNAMNKNVDKMNKSLIIMTKKLDNLEPMLNNMKHMNKSMIEMKHSMNNMDQDMYTFRQSFTKPMNIINSIPFL